jgi:hypothetical protein
VKHANIDVKNKKGQHQLIDADPFDAVPGAGKQIQLKTKTYISQG